MAQGLAAMGASVIAADRYTAGLMETAQGHDQNLITELATSVLQTMRIGLSKLRPMDLAGSISA